MVCIYVWAMAAGGSGTLTSAERFIFAVCNQETSIMGVLKNDSAIKARGIHKLGGRGVMEAASDM